MASPPPAAKPMPHDFVWGVSTRLAWPCRQPTPAIGHDHITLAEDILDPAEAPSSPPVRKGK